MGRPTPPRPPRAHPQGDRPGDFNLPKAQPGDPIFDALTARGLTLPPHSTRIASTIATDAQYDQVAFFPGESAADFTGQAGAFDFDGALFAELWRTRSREDFLAYLRFHLSDHGPILATRLERTPCDAASSH
jgi:hypothetical protein